MLDLAMCLKRIEGGLQVRYRDGVESPKGTPVRVLMARAHPAGGAASDFPQPGELGLVARVDEGISVWVGSLPPWTLTRSQIS